MQDVLKGNLNEYHGSSLVEPVGIKHKATTVLNLKEYTLPGVLTGIVCAQLKEIMVIPQDSSFGEQEMV